MKHTVLKDFDYAHDGLTPKRVVKDDVIHVRDELVAGLFGAGFISKGKGPAPVAEGDIAKAPAKDAPKPAEGAAETKDAAA